jgi:heme-degrading monooxygenase HmoA
MFARVTTIQGPASSVDEARRSVEQQVLPAVQHMKGFRGILALVDRNTGKSMSITLWESADAMRQSEEAANRLRTSAAADSAAQILGVERFEVVVDTTTTAGTV